eukprot:TRINITY_DN4328_c0_g1_i1.p1 TRINITY_DN4328_c0_g1~~TRINITY_DN4328_c0_g1_i1.p1  ORF type:complete len:283 (-),score=53.66 TRINITY_DN4328_c0_g1_i1:190-1038(-)
MDVEATVAAALRGEPQYWPSDEKKLREVLNCNEQAYHAQNSRRCNRLGVASAAFPFEIDLQEAMGDVTSASDSYVTLLPGEVTVISVVVDVYPRYDKGLWGDITLSTFFVAVDSVKAYKQVLPFNQRNQANIRVKFSVNKAKRALLKQPKTSFVDFLNLGGSWVGLWGLAGLLLSSIYKGLKMFGHLGPKDGDIVGDSAQDLHNEEMQMKREKAAKQIKDALEERYREYGIEVDLQKVHEHLVDVPGTRNVQKTIPLSTVLKDTDIRAGLPDFVLLHLDNNA